MSIERGWLYEAGYDVMICTIAMASKLCFGCMCRNVECPSKLL
jgi:hypothetical protein